MSSDTVTIEQAYAIALTHHQAGQFVQAENIYRQILTVLPEEPDVLHLLGVALSQTGRPAEGAGYVARCLALNPDHATAYSNLGEIRKSLGQWEEAQVCCERACALAPDFADAYNNLGTVHLHFKRLDEARPCFERAIALQPAQADAHYNLGMVVGRLGLRDEAFRLYRKALTLRPDYPEVYNNLGNMLTAQGKIEEACAHFRRALELRANYAQAHGNLGIALIAGHRFAEARAACERSLALDPNDGGVHSNLGHIFQQSGQIDLALASYRRAIALQPDNAAIRSNLIHTLHLDPATDAALVRAECQRWDRQHAAPLRAALPPPTNDPDPARRLRIGYVSPDFWDHAVSHFIAPLLAAHDHTHFEIHGYASGHRSDAVTARLRGLADRWHEVTFLSDEALAARVRADGIDILVDLTVHTAENRLLTFARRPAPVQVSWLGYAGTSGLASIDYRLTDAHIDPPALAGGGAAWSAEEPVRLPDSWCCYEPLADSPAVGGLPALGPGAAGAVTFGSLNHFGKCNERVLRLWARVLAAVPGSRLLMYCADAGARLAVCAEFARAGVAESRLEFVSRIPKREYLRLYGDRVDLALDPFPHNGMTTTCEALWMGVPVLTLPGVLPVSRTSLSLLSTIGLPELVARDEDDYLRIAVELTHDLPRLAALRAGLRERMQTSPLMDAPRFARNVESAYRAMWRRWCVNRV